MILTSASQEQSRISAVYLSGGEVSVYQELTRTIFVKFLWPRVEKTHKGRFERFQDSHGGVQKTEAEQVIEEWVNSLG